MRYTMKKLLPSIFISLGVIVVTLVLYLFQCKVIDFNDNELSVSEHEMRVDINEDGSMYIVEDVTLELDSYWNYVIKDIGYAKNEKVEDQLGFEINNARSTFDEGSFVCRVYNEKGKEIKPNILNNYDLDQSKYRSFKISSPGNFVTGVRMHYEYRILNAVTVYEDVAELNWILIDYWDYLTSDIDIDINLPASTDLSSVKFFGHGVARKNAVEQNGRNFDIDIDKLHSGELIEVRILFNKEAISQVDESKIVHHDAKEAILTIEENIALEQAALRKTYYTSMVVALSLFGVMVVLVIFKARSVYVKYNDTKILLQSIPERCYLLY